MLWATFLGGGVRSGGICKGRAWAGTAFQGDAQVTLWHPCLVCEAWQWWLVSHVLPVACLSPVCLFFPAGISDLLWLLGDRI